MQYNMANNDTVFDLSRDGESDRLVESNLLTITSKTATQRHSYGGGTSSWSPTKVKYSKRISDPRPTSAPAKASNTGISRHEESTHAQSIRSKYGLGNKMEKNTQVCVVYTILNIQTYSRRLPY